MSKGEIKNPFSGPSSDKRLECLTSLDREIGEIKQFVIGWEISVRASYVPVLFSHRPEMDLHVTCSTVEKLKALQYLIVVVSTIDLAVWLTSMIPMATL